MRIVLLFSGGYDSSLAAIYLGRKEEVYLLYFDLLGFVPPLPLKIAERISELLGKDIPIYLVNFKGVVEEISSKVDRKYRQVILKRAMLKAANRFAKEFEAEAIGTGEVIGQVSTQTLRSLRIIEEASDFPILRPISGLDKEEIVEEIRRYGLYELCSKVKEYCNIAGRRVVTWPNLEKTKKEEEKIKGALKRVFWKKYPKIEEEEVEFLEEVPPGAVLIDLSGEGIPGALSLEEVDLEEMKGKTVVLYCRSGGLSMEYARELRRMGIEAHPLSPKAGRKLKYRKR